MCSDSQLSISYYSASSVLRLRLLLHWLPSIPLDAIILVYQQLTQHSSKCRVKMQSRVSNIISHVRLCHIVMGLLWVTLEYFYLIYSIFLSRKLLISCSGAYRFERADDPRSNAFSVQTV